MARFVRLRTAIVNLDTVAVIRPLAADAVTLVTTLGYTEHLEGEDAIDFLALVFREAVAPVTTVDQEQLVHAWLGLNAPVYEIAQNEDEEG
ncbi:MAG: hypothetical protein RMJ05_03895 [Thermomicrobium sp.]|nr:hypothetical protein [Thermomicrobium sp.]MDW8005839.1 hypothetical protein [Thermomicrobium sp.]